MSCVTLLEPDLRLIRAPNPSPLTGDGTNSYILGRAAQIVIDPGPEDAAHLARLMAALADGGPVEAILVTHTHLDHSPLAHALSTATGAPVMGFGTALAGRSARMQALAASGMVSSGESVDLRFRPDRVLAHGETVSCGPETLRALWTPGHFGNHLCFEWRGAVFSGDHVMGWSTSLVAPPDGDMAAYRASLERLHSVGARRLYPGHGDPVPDPAARIAELCLHRAARERAIVTALDEGPLDIGRIVARVYTQTPPALHRAAARNVLAHLIDLEARGLVRADPSLGEDALFMKSRA